MTTDGFIELGVVVKPHGFKGSFLVRSSAGEQSALRYIKNLYVGSSSTDAQPLSVSEAAWMPKGWKISVNEIESEEAVDTIRGQSLFARRADLEEPGSNEFYVEDLVGLPVWDCDASRPIGSLMGVEPLSDRSIGGDRWWIKTQTGKEVAIPANARYVEEVNTKQGYIRLRNVGELC
ncbi:MAG: 16S rRNA processing protein RimM [Bdellovibrionaceae bacterium]|nr:16S rRNA processing protein RimM [Bdellovibrionales bacterium]MCB9254712.1 16S rRNA processing protein RimM [Pseudobdellovibrionaceae bacterium]